MFVRRALADPRSAFGRNSRGRGPRTDFRTLGLVLALLVLPACGGEVAALFVLVTAGALGAWFVARDRSRALIAAEQTRLALESGEPRELEMQLRRELALADAGEGVSAERQWLARARLGGLLVAEWRLEEARAVYGGPLGGLAGERARKRGDAKGVSQLDASLADLARFGDHELAVLAEPPTLERIGAIRADREHAIGHAPSRHRAIVSDAWRALEGLALARIGRAREAVPLLEAGLASLAYNPARVVYLFHLGQALEALGEAGRAGELYAQASRAFPGSRLANEALVRGRALTGGDGLFRGMLPEAPRSTPEDESPPA